MSSDFERLVGRAVMDKAFRDKVLANPETAAKDAGFNLAAKELDDLKAGVESLQKRSTSDQIDQHFASGALGFWR